MGECKGPSDSQGLIPGQRWVTSSAQQSPHLWRRTGLPDLGPAHCPIWASFLDLWAFAASHQMTYLTTLMAWKWPGCLDVLAQPLRGGQQEQKPVISMVTLKPFTVPREREPGRVPVRAIIPASHVTARLELSSDYCFSPRTASHRNATHSAGHVETTLNSVN